MAFAQHTPTSKRPHCVIWMPRMRVNARSRQEAIDLALTQAKRSASRTYAPIEPRDKRAVLDADLICKPPPTDLDAYRCGSWELEAFATRDLSPPPLLPLLRGDHLRDFKLHRLQIRQQSASPKSPGGRSSSTPAPARKPAFSPSERCAPGATSNSPTSTPSMTMKSAV